jgi:hypothetical protein
MEKPIQLNLTTGNCPSLFICLHDALVALLPFSQVKARKGKGQGARGFIALFLSIVFEFPGWYGYLKNALMVHNNPDKEKQNRILNLWEYSTN